MGTNIHKKTSMYPKNRFFALFWNYLKEAYVCARLLLTSLDMVTNCPIKKGYGNRLIHMHLLHSGLLLAYFQIQIKNNIF